MSAELRAAAWIAVRAAWLALACGSASAGSMLEALDARWVDPLLVRPPVLDTGAALSGDMAPADCEATDAWPDPLTLSQAARLALCHHPKLAGARASIESQAAQLGEARAAYLPSASLGISPTSDRSWSPNAGAGAVTTPVPRGDTTTRATNSYANLRWRLFDFGGRQASERAAEALLDAALASGHAQVQGLLAEIVQAYFDAQTHQSAWLAQQESETLARRTLQSTERREQRGAGSQTDTLQAAAALAKASLERSRAEGSFRKAMAMLVSAMGLPATSASSLALAPQAEIESSDATQAVRRSVDSWLAEAQQGHPAIAAARARVAAAREKASAVAAEAMPTLDLTGTFSQNGRPNQGLTPVRTREALVGLTLNVPLFDGFAQGYRHREAQAQVDARQAELIEAQQQVMTDVVKAHADARSAWDNLDASGQWLSSALAAQASVQRRFDIGGADLLELLNALQVAGLARQERVRSLADWRTACLGLLAAAGALHREDMVRAPEARNASMREPKGSP